MEEQAVRRKKTKAGRGASAASVDGSTGRGEGQQQQMQQHYVRPKDPSSPTRHLFVVGCGPQTGLSSLDFIFLLI
jgi:hypothetical protein